MARPSGPADFYRARHTSFTYHHVPHLHAFSSHQCPCVSAVPPPQLLYDHCGFVGGVGGGLKSNFICGNSGGGAGDYSVSGQNYKVPGHNVKCS